MPVKKRRVLFTSGKRKTAIARAVTKLGEGKITINNIPIEIYSPELARRKLMSPLLVTEDVWKKLNISVKVQGGGFLSQAEAASMAIARAIANWHKGSKMKKILTDYDRTLLAGDPRRKEPKKFGGPGARRRKQKSYR